ncbi:uncharacterized protein MEPE_04683 [Melanopsichium pennsylvanicum]|uniref:Uncharacterized protein n=1 Tax=Melanopsichium pennsylvanicum TaxID=63383 RepID=A0AAJ4XN59_9BASI|nr:uncharacterized protein MEPE_04683 [Melanopsichium pennsylvanicum]
MTHDVRLILRLGLKKECDTDPIEESGALMRTLLFKSRLELCYNTETSMMKAGHVNEVEFGTEKPVLAYTVHLQGSDPMLVDLKAS